jgi:hypothetical protein
LLSGWLLGGTLTLCLYPPQNLVRFEHIEAAKLAAEGCSFKKIATHFGRSGVWACNLFRQPFFQARVDSILREKTAAEWEWRMVEPFRDRDITKKINYLRAASRRPRDSLGRFCG